MYSIFEQIKVIKKEEEYYLSKLAIKKFMKIINKLDMRWITCKHIKEKSSYQR